MRSGGITLVEHGRAGNVADDTIASSLKNDAVNSHLGDKIVFYFEDVLRGYRVDIFTEQTGVWNSLCQRVAEYGWADGAGPRLDPAKDEGYVSGASTTTKPPEELRRAPRKTTTCMSRSSSRRAGASSPRAPADASAPTPTAPHPPLSATSSASFKKKRSISEARPTPTPTVHPSRAT